MPPLEPNAHPALEIGPFRVRRVDYPPHLRQEWHRHELAGMTVILGGAIRETTRRGEAFGSTLSVVVKPAGVRHANEVGPRGARTLQVVFSESTPGELSEGEALARWRWLHGPPASRPLLALARALRSDHGEREGPKSGAPTSGGPKGRALEDRVIEAIAALDGAPPAESGIPDWLSTVREALDDRLHDGIGVRELAEAVGVHPVSVSRAFRRHYGVTVTEYRRRERVRRAAAAIERASRPLSSIAYATGHADQPHLCREFRRLTGLTPTEFRRLSGTP